MRKMERKKARVSSHWNPQVPNFSITNQTALISEPILRLRITRWVSRVEKGGGSAWRSSTAIHTRFALLPLDAQGPALHMHCYGVRTDQELEDSCNVETAHRSLRRSCQAHFLFCTRISPGCYVRYLLFKSPGTIYFLVPLIGNNSATKQAGCTVHRRKQNCFFLRL